MAVSFGTLRAVNPYSLATVSGVTKIPGFASSPIPPVIRPDLLTSQLMGCHPQCENCNGTHAGPSGSGFASYISPDYGTLRGLGDDGEYGLFKMFSSQGSLPAGPGGGEAPSMSGLGKGAVGTNAASTYATRSWSHGLRGLGKGAVGTNAASVYATRSWAHGLRGLGQTTTDTTPDNFKKLLDNLLGAFRSGANEADVIVNQAQNPLMNNLGTITNQFLIGTNPSLATLQALYMQVWRMAVNFMQFVLSPKFTDRRASGQALNTVMPTIDGSCGYPVPLPPGNQAIPSRQNCMNWGSGSIGGDGTTGMLGALGRAITTQGGTVPTLTNVQQGASGVAPTANPAAGFGPLAAGLPATLGGISTTTWILIALGVVMISRMK